MDDRINDSGNNELDNILSEFAGTDEQGSPDDDIAVLADKYQVDVQNLRLPERRTDSPRTRRSSAPRDGEYSRGRSARDYSRPGYSRRRDNDRTEERMRRAEEARTSEREDKSLPPGHKLVYEDKNLSDPSERANRTASKAPVNQDGMRVVFDADALDPMDERVPYDDFGNTYGNDWRSAASSGKSKQKKSHAVKREDRSLAYRFFTGIIPWKGDDKKEALRKLLRTFSVCAVAVSLAFIGMRVMDSYDSITKIPPLNEPETDENNNYVDPRDKFPGVVFPEGLLDIFVTAYATNNDFAGRLLLQGLDNKSIELPVVKSKDNNDYLYKDYTGGKNRFGTLFLDMNGNIDGLNQNNTIHGHNMRDASQFAILEDFITPDGFINSPTFTYYTRYKMNRFKIYAVIITNAKESEDNGYRFYYPYPTFMSETHFNGYVKMLDEKKLYTTGVDIQYGDTLMCLSTCHDSVYKTLRLVVIGRMIREGESDYVDLSKVQINENPRYPQVWYDKKKQTNPFANSFKWHWNQEELEY